MTRPALLGRPRPSTVGTLGGSSGQPPGGEPTPDCCDPGADPIDRGAGGSAVSLSPAGVVALVQAKAFGQGGATGAILGPHALDDVPTPGNILIADLGLRLTDWDDATFLGYWPSGWTTLVGNNFAGVDSQGHVYRAKVVQSAADQEIEFSSAITGSLVLSEWAGFGGALPVVDTSAVSDVTDDATPAIPAVTPTSSISALLLASVWKKAAGPNPGPSTLTGYTLVDDSQYIGTGNRHRLTSWYQIIASASGTYGPTDISSTGDATDDSNVIHAVLETAPDAASWVVPAPNVTDGADATYDTITGTDLLRIDLGAPFRISSTRIRIAATNSGSRTFTIKAANAADFSDEVTIATIAFTATGSLTAQDVTGSWVTTEAYQFWELSIGTSDTYRLHAWELIEATLAGDLSAHITDPTDAHDASAVSIVDAGAYFTGTDVEAALQELGAGSAGAFLTTTEGGGDVVSTVAAAGATETLDLTDGNVHDVTLTANCVFTFAAVAGGAGRSFSLILRQDGTGGWTTTWPGTVEWPNGIAPTLPTGAGEVAVLTFLTIDGGAVWYGFASTGGSTIDYAEAGDLAPVGETAAAGVSAEIPRADHVHTIDADAVQSAGHWEVVVSGSAPPVAVSTPSDDDWVYGWVAG